jgi:hypothetical protein
MNNVPGNYKLTSADAKPRSVKGGMAHALSMRRKVEDEFLSIGDIAKRLRVSRDTARKRYQREAEKPGPITWQGIMTK